MYTANPGPALIAATADAARARRVISSTVLRATPDKAEPSPPFIAPRLIFFPPLWLLSSPVSRESCRSRYLLLPCRGVLSPCTFFGDISRHTSEDSDRCLKCAWMQMRMKVKGRKSEIWRASHSLERVRELLKRDYTHTWTHTHTHTDHWKESTMVSAYNNNPRA